MLSICLRDAVVQRDNRFNPQLYFHGTCSIVSSLCTYYSVSGLGNGANSVQLSFAVLALFELIDNISDAALYVVEARRQRNLLYANLLFHKITWPLWVHAFEQVSFGLFLAAPLLILCFAIYEKLEWADKRQRRKEQKNNEKLERLIGCGCIRRRCDFVFDSLVSVCFGFCYFGAMIRPTGW